MTLSDGPYVGVVDRFEDEQAVVILERDGTEVGDVLVPKSRLPHRARRQNAIVRVVLKDGDVVDVWYDAEATRDRGASAQARFDRIAEPAPKKRDESEGDDEQEDEEREDDARGDVGDVQDEDDGTNSEQNENHEQNGDRE